MAAAERPWERIRGAIATPSTEHDELIEAAVSVRPEPYINRHAGLRALLAVALVGMQALVCAQDTPEMLAAMRAALPPVPTEVPTWDSLPADLRQQMPVFNIDMHRWHVDPAQSFVLIDGRRVEPGGVAGRELWLRAVREEGVVMQFRERLFFHPR